MKKVLLFLFAACFVANLTAFSQASLYGFSSSTGASLETITVPVVLTTVTNGNTDDGSNLVSPAGFTFNFNGTDYTQFLMNTNAWLKMGNVTPTGNIPASLTTMTSTNGIYAFGRDANMNVGNSGNFTHGPAAGGKYVFQWTKNAGGSSGAEDASNYATFQIVLWGSTSTTPGKIEIVYGTIAGTPASGGVIGIADANGTYLNAVNGTTNNLATTTAYPAAGTKYTFIAPLPCASPTAQPTGLVLTSAATSIAGNFTDASPIPNKYLVVRTPGAAALTTMPTDQVTYTAGGILGNGTVVGLVSTASFTNTGLTSSTSYTYTLFSVNDLCTSGPLYMTTAPLTGTISTTGIQTYTWAATSGSAAWSTPASWSPVRNLADPSDILEFSAGGTSTATGITTTTIGRINVRNNTAINLQASATAILTIASDGTATDELNIAAGSNLTLNSPAFALTLTYSGTGSTGTIAGTAETTSPATGTVVNTLLFSGGTTPVTTVTATGILAAGQSTGTGVPVITGSAATLIINGTYNHKFQVAAGTIPTATWNTGSKVNITGYNATVTAGPGGFTQTFYDVEWNCASQTTNIGCAGSLPTINGAFTLTSTGAGTNYLSLTATTAYTKTWANFVQTGGILDLGTGASGSNALTITGTFNQAGGTLKSTGTGTSSTTLNFASTTTQSVIFTGQPTGPIIYRVSATNGITLNANITPFVIGNGTLGGLIISTLAATPITFSGVINAFQYNALGSTLTYNAAGSYTMTAREFPATNGPANLTIAVGTGNVITMPASFGSRSLSPAGASGVLTMTSGDLDISSNTLILGTSTAFPGTLTWTAGSIRVTTGTLTRWFGTSGLPTAAGTAIGYFPLASGISNRNVSIYFSGTTALSTGGTMTIGHNDAAGMAAVSIADGAYTIQQRTNAYWPISQSGLVASGTISARITGGNLVVTSGNNLRLMQLAAVAGTFVASSGTSPNFQVARTGLSVTNIAQNQYMGAANADLNYLSIASGNWENGTTWNKGTVPTGTDIVTIANGNTVTVNATAAAASSLAVNAGGALTVSGSTLTVNTTLTNNGTVNASAGTVTITSTLSNAGTFNASGATINVTAAATTGITNAATTGVFNLSGGAINLGITDNTFCNRTFANSGTLTVSSGSLNIYGNFNNVNGSTFNQSGGTITVDGNAGGVLANSVAAATNIVNFGTSGTTTTISLTGGSIVIVDPHASTSAAGGTSNGHAFIYWGSGYRSGTGHTVQIGNGVSTDAGGNTSGYQYDPWPGTGYFIAGNLIINAPAGTNRVVSQLYAVGVEGNLTVSNGEFLASNSSLKVAGNITVNTPAKLTVNNLVMGSWGSDLTQVNSIAASTNAQTISGTGTFQNLTSSPTANFGLLTVYNTNASGVTFGSGISKPTLSNGITVTDGKLTADSIALQGTAAQPVVLTATTSNINVANFTVNNNSGAAFTGLGKLNVTNTVAIPVGVVTVGGSTTLVLKSSAAGTARIAELSAGIITGNVTQERYIPAKSGRTWTFIASPFTQSISSAWQQQVHITGTGTGGTICPSLTAHSNGFDATLSNAASMFVYDGTKAVNTRWTSVTGTTAVNLTAGTGYRMNIRGPRSLGCSLLDGSVSTVTAVTLSSTGTLNNANNNVGNFFITLLNNGNTTVANDNYLLAGNPYPSEISFNGLWNNNTAIKKAYAIYAPGNTVGNYAFWNGTTWTGGTTGLTDATGDIIANGQAFFVQAVTAGANVDLYWRESVKTTTASNGYFRQLNPNRLRIGYLLPNGSKADEIMVQFAANATNDKINSEDVVSINSGTQYLKSLKAGNGLAFNTRNSSFTNDTVHLNVVSSTSGSFKLSFYDFDQFVSGTNARIYLVDSYTGTTQLMNDTKEYPFTVNMSDAASQGTNRFAVVFSKPTPIAMPIVSATALKAYPNPVGDNLTVELPTVAGGWTLTMVDMYGKTVMEQQVQDNATNLKTGKLARGTYTLQAVDSKGNKQVQKLVKQ